MDAFSEAEKVGRDIWNDKLVKNGSSGITFTESRFDSIDVIWEKYDTTYVGEIKYREKYNSSANCFSEQGVMLEKRKYDALKYYQDASGFTPYYIHIYNDNKMSLYNLTDMNDLEWVVEENKFPKTTKGNRDKVPKLVTYLSLDSGALCSYTS